MSQVIKNFSIDQIVNIEGYKVRIHNYCGTTLIRTRNGVADMQLYEVTLKNGELAYASDAGLMKNDYSIFDKIIAGIGYRGNINYSMFKTEYTMWKDMIYRCHSVNNRLYPFYGGAGITIVPRWYCFELFVYDSKRIYHGGKESMIRAGFLLRNIIVQMYMKIQKGLKNSVVIKRSVDSLITMLLQHRLNMFNINLYQMVDGQRKHIFKLFKIRRNYQYQIMMI